MKKNTLSLVGCVVCGSSLLFAGQLLADATGRITIEGDIGGDTDGPALSAKVSPNVTLGYVLETTGGTSFAINTENKSIDLASTNRNQYGIASDYSGYYQQVATADLVAPTDADSSSFTGWTKF